MSKRHQLWLDAFYSASLNFKSECGVVLLALEDLARDGNDRLVSLLVGFDSSRLRILNGADVECEIPLAHMAVAMCTFSMDGSLPGIAVGAQSSLYIYKNFKPFYKYVVPREGAGEEAEIVQLAAVARSSPDMSSSSMIIVGTEAGSIIIIDSQTFNAISKVEIKCTPTAIRCCGYFDVDANIIIASHDGRVYHLRSTQLRARLIVTASSPIVDVTFVGSFLAVATANKAVKFYTLQVYGYNFSMLVIAITSVEVKSQDASILAVSLADGSLLFYRQGALLEQFQSSSPIVSMASGRFGREDGVLVMVTRDGDVAVKVLNRAFKLEPLDSNPTGSANGDNNNKNEILPTKTKLFVEQALREQQDPKQMYRKFQEGMCRAHLRALQEWCKLSSIKELEPMESGEDGRCCVNLLAKLVAGPRMTLQLLVQNVNDVVLESLTLVLHVTGGKLALDRSHVQLPLMIPYEERRVRVSFRDPANRGGQLTVVVTKAAGSKSSLVVCSANIDISPTI